MDMTPNGPGAGRPDVADVLRSALEREASTVEVTPDALGDIRRRIANRRAKWLPRPLRTPGGVMFTTLGSAAAAAVVLVAVGVGSCVPQPVNHPPIAGGSTSAGPSGSPSTGSTSPSTSPTPGPVVHTLIPVYYVGDGSALYREFRDVQIPRNYQPAQLKSALSSLLHTAPLDPDYWSPWNYVPVDLNNIQVDAAGVVTVDFGGALTVAIKGPGQLSPAGYRATVQALIWTVTAVPGVTGVRILNDGRPVTSLWGQPTGGVLHRASAVDTLAPIWIIDPQQNAVTGRSVTINLAGIVFEARVTVDIYDSHGTSVYHAGVNLSIGAPAQGIATLHVTLPKGTYRIVAAPATFKDGATPPQDDHTFTVH
jgi:hypothetical protein